MKKKVVIIAIVVTVIFIFIFGGLMSIYSSFNGNPFVKTSFTSKVKDYVKEKWPGTEFEVSRAVYDFKCNNYICYVQSTSSIDTAFRVYKLQSGEIRDSYDMDVLEKEKTICRFLKELEKIGDEELLPDYNRRTRLFGCSFYDEREIDRSKFQLDMDFAADKLPFPAALSIWTETEQERPSWEELAEALKEAVSLTEDHNIDIKYYSIILEYPYEEDENKNLVPVNYDSDIRGDNVPKDVIKGDNLVEYLKSHGKRP